MIKTNEIQNLFTQLDFLIGFLDVSDESIYNKIRFNDRFDYEHTISEIHRSGYIYYQNTIMTSALILSFTHFESFVTKMIEKLLIINPNSNKIKFTIKTLNEAGENNIEDFAKKQSTEMTFLEKIIFLKNSFPDINKSLLDDLIFVNRIKNCIIHNNGYANEYLQPDFVKSQKIILTRSKVNEFGLKAREFSKFIWSKVNS